MAHEGGLCPVHIQNGLITEISFFSSSTVRNKDMSWPEEMSFIANSSKMDRHKGELEDELDERIVHGQICRRLVVIVRHCLEKTCSDWWILTVLDYRQTFEGKSFSHHTSTQCTVRYSGRQMGDNDCQSLQQNVVI